MKTSTNFARVAVTAGLTAAMALGNVVAPAAMALADTGSTVTFVDNNYAASTTYKGIQIFKAKVATTGGTQTVSNIEWANDDAKKAVLDAIKAKDASFAGENAQDAADWLNVHAGGGSRDRHDGSERRRPEHDRRQPESQQPLEYHN